MLLPVVLLVSFAAVFTAILALNAILTNKRTTITERLNNIGLSGTGIDPDEELSKPFMERVIKPLIKNMGDFSVKITPKDIVVRFESKIAAAGVPYNLRAKDWLTIQFIISLGLPIVTIVLGSLFQMDLKTMLLVMATEIITGLLIPNYMLSKSSKDRKNEITKTLPDILDLLTVSVESGLSFDSALSKVVEKMPGVLAKEFDKVLQEIKIGKSKKDALKAMSDRVEVVDFTTLIAAIIQAEQLGIGIGDVLRIQSHQMRIVRRQRAQEQAMKAPVKMLIPMVMFIFPVIFIVILGPAALQIMNGFMK